MAFRTFTLLLALLKLALVRIGFVTIAAIGERKLGLEVSVQVASHARNLDVFSNEWIFCFGMVEIKARQKIFPTAGGVAAFARFLELTLVRVEVARGAGIELHVLIANRTAGRFRLVALFARNFYVQAGERITRLGVVEILSRFPVFHVVALGAFVAKLPFVRIAVAGSAIRGLAEKGFAQVLHLDEFAIRGKHVCGRVALFANEIGVLAFEFVAREFVVKFLQRRLPANQVEIFAVVFQVAAHAVFSIGIAHLHFKVVSVLRGKILRNFLVAIDALERGRASSEGMAGSALRSAAERRVGLG